MLHQVGGPSVDWQPMPWAPKYHGFSRSGRAHLGLVGVTNSNNIETLERNGPLLGAYFSPGGLGGGDTEERFCNRIFKLSSSGSLSPQGAPWWWWVEGEAVEGGGPGDARRAEG